MSEKLEKKIQTKLAPISPNTEPWKVLKATIKEMVAEDEVRFGHLQNCKLRLFWAKDWKADADQIVVGAQVCKANEIDRLLVEGGEGKGESPDIFIKLPKTQWPKLDQDEKTHRLYHELCHIRPALDTAGNQKRDSLDRPLWRLGRHPITAFHEEVERFGVDRVLGHNGTILKSIETADRPLLAAMEKANAAEDAADESAAAAGSMPASKSTNIDTDADGWKRLAITELQLPPAVETFVISAGYRRIGKFSEYMAEKADFWDRDLKVGDQRKPPNFRAKIEEAFLTFWKDHPEYTQAAQA
jgi:hypothetical protein